MTKRSLKKQKMDQEDDEHRLALYPYHIQEEEEEEEDEEEDKGDDEMTEEALALLLKKLENRVNRCESRIEHYQSKMNRAEIRMVRTKEILYRLRSKKEESSVKKPLLLIPPKIISNSTLAVFSSSQRDSTPRASNLEIAHKKRTEKNERLGFLREVNASETPNILNFDPSHLFVSHHKKKVRSLEICPNDNNIFATSALDGLINLWEVDSLRASLVCSFDFLSPKERRWPEDIAWHPQRNHIFSVHTADNDESQVAKINATKSGVKKAVFLEGKPHVKGIINRITFMPWLNRSPCFTTCGSDHALVLWKEGEQNNSWIHHLLHRDFHTSSVMAAFGLGNKQAVLSVGKDKRVVLYNVDGECCEFKYVLDEKCLNVLSHPDDSNLYMVQLGVPKRQLRLFDIRQKQKEIHAFGWNQESSESQSALVNPSWSPDGWRVSTGSADNIIHLFDIRYNKNAPSQSIKAHSKRVFKAAWHQTLPLLISISSDLNIGLHNYH